MIIILKATVFGFIIGFALVLGAIIGIFVKTGKRVLAMIMAFGSGVLICALTFELMEEAYRKGGFDAVTIGFICGAIFFTIGDFLVDRWGGHYRKSGHSKKFIAQKLNKGKSIELSENFGSAVLIGALLDGVPESIAIGVSLLAGKGLGLLMVAAVFLSNVPEGISGAASMKEAKKSKFYILLLWSIVGMICFFSTILGLKVFAGFSQDIIAFILALAAGSILAMIADTMMPEAFEEGGRIIGLITVIGFLIAFVVSRLAR